MKEKINIKTAGYCLIMLLLLTGLSACNNRTM